MEDLEATASHIAKLRKGREEELSKPRVQEAPQPALFVVGTLARKIEMVCLDV